MVNELSSNLRAPSVPLDTRAGELPLQLTATRAHLRHVFWARNAVLMSVCLWLAFVTGDFPSPWVLVILAAGALVNAVTWLRLKQAAPVSYGEFLAQMLADVVLISAGLHHSDDSLAILSFVPLTVAAATLPWRQTLIVFVAIFALHEFICHYLPGAVWSNPTERRLDLLAGGLIAYFVFCMARSSRTHGELLARMREKYLGQRHAAELGTVAASAAHQLASPLATLAVVVGELRASLGESAEQRSVLDVMARQIDTCKKVSSQLLAFTGHERAERGGRLAADQFVAGIVEKCRLMQPWMAVEHRAKEPAPAPELLADLSLEHAILVLLHSTAGAPRQIEIVHDWDHTHLKIRLCDCGPVSPVAADGEAGMPLFAFQQPPESKHFDLLMAKVTIDRFGGKIERRDDAGGCLCIEVLLPLSSQR